MGSVRAPLCFKQGGARPFSGIFTGNANVLHSFAANVFQHSKMTVTESSTLLSRYAGANNVYLERLNLVRAELYILGNWPDLLRVVELSVTEDADTGFSVVALPATYSTILAGVPKAPGATNHLCGGIPMGVRNVFDWFNQTGAGYGSVSYNFQQLGPDGSGSKRYVVPSCDDDDYTYIALVKEAYVALTQNSDVVKPNNVAALKAGFQALLAEDADNDGLAEQKWERAVNRLSQQSENETGAGASGIVEIRDDLNLCMIGSGL